MNSKQRVLTAIDHRRPDRVPIDFGAHPQVCADLRAYLGLADDVDLAPVFGVDLAGVGPAIKHQASPVCYADPTREVTADGLFIDLWGVGFRRAQTPTGEYIDIAHHPLAGDCGLPRIESHTYMDPDDWEYSGIRAAAESRSDRAVWVHCRGTFEISWFIRGMDGFMLDLALEPKKPRPVLPVPTRPEAESALARELDTAAVVGLFTGFFGVGGGFVIVPALVLALGFDMPDAVGTSLLVIAMNSLAGFLGHISGGASDLTALLSLTTIFAAAGLVGAFTGARLAGRLPATHLRRLFGGFVIVLAIILLVDNVPKV